MESLFTYVRAAAAEVGADFSVGRMRQDRHGPYRIFTIYGRNPWQGILCHDGKCWYYTGDCWPL